MEDRSLPVPVEKAVANARFHDREAMLHTYGVGGGGLRTYGEGEEARERIQDAGRSKYRALGALLPQPSSGGPQCGNGKDDDGDGTRDAPYDSGCTNVKDGSEGSPLTCSLGYAPTGSLYVVQGTCSGPFFEIEISALPGAKFDTKRVPVVAQDRVCGLSETRLDCVMGDGVANPRHEKPEGEDYRLRRPRPHNDALA